MASTVLAVRPAAQVAVAQALTTSSRPALSSRAALAPRQALARKALGAVAPVKAVLRSPTSLAVRASAAAAPGAGAGRSEDTQVCKAAEVAVPGDNEPQGFMERMSEKYPSLVTGFFFFLWYFLNVIFNILNKKIYNYFPYPYFVSTIHLLVGVAYCLVSWAVGLPKRAPISKDLIFALAPVAFCHALGHVMTNVSFSSVAVSFTHTIKSLEPFFSASASQFILNQPVPIHLWLSLMPVVIGVVMASVTEVSFSWTGFITAMISNISFTYRNIFSKKAMTGMDSTNLYAYISILSLIYCVPLAIVLEGPQLMATGFSNAIAQVGTTKFITDLFWVGMFYHLYNQLANNTLERVSPLTHAVGNVLKRVFVIGFSIIVFGNRISTQTGVGTAIAIAGVALYSTLKAQQTKQAKH